MLQVCTVFHSLFIIYSYIIIIFFFRLKLFLEQFGIHTCVLNSELPASCRYHTICQFNNNIYDIIIASDEKILDEEHDISTNKTR